jgi:CubicO group peptidase (beta-lactamase class C family)
VRTNAPVPFATVENGAIVAARHGEMVVPWWSFTKTIIAAAALTLVRDGVLQLDARLPGGAWTLRQLLQHTAGLGDYGDLPAYHDAVAAGGEPWTVSELLSRARADALLAAPGRTWRYSNIGYLRVRRILESTDGAALDDVLRRRVLAPIGIVAPRIASTRSDLTGVEMGDAEGYDPGWVYHGLLVGPLRDAALLLDRLISGALLPPPLLGEMLSPHPLGGPIEARPWRAPAYGLGVMIDIAQGLIGHTGGGPGSVVAVYHAGEPGRGRTIAVFASGQDQGLVERIAFGA